MVFYIRSTEGKLYPPLFGAGEVQVGHGEWEFLHGGRVQPRHRSAEGRGSPSLGAFAAGSDRATARLVQR